MTSIGYQILQFSCIIIEFALFGVLCHVLRGLINPFPDKISNNAAVNIFVSSGYSWGDHILGTEYHDVTGYYKLDSLKNLKISVWSTIIAGTICLAVVPETASGLFKMNEWLYELFINRLSELFL